MSHDDILNPVNWRLNNQFHQLEESNCCAKHKVLVSGLFWIRYEMNQLKSVMDNVGHLSLNYLVGLWRHCNKQFGLRNGSKVNRALQVH